MNAPSQEVLFETLGQMVGLLKLIHDDLGSLRRRLAARPAEPGPACARAARAVDGVRGGATHVRVVTVDELPASHGVRGGVGSCEGRACRT